MNVTPEYLDQILPLFEDLNAQSVVKRLKSALINGGIDPFPLLELPEFFRSRDIEVPPLPLPKVLRARPSRILEGHDAYSALQEVTPISTVLVSDRVPLDIVKLWAKVWTKATTFPTVKALFPHVHRVRYTDRERATASWKNPVLELTTKKDLAITVETLVHEFGHVLKSHKQVNINSWSDEVPWGKAPFVSSYAEMNSEEDFAETFAWHILRPSKLKSRCPLKAQHMAKLT